MRVRRIATSTAGVISSPSSSSDSADSESVSSSSELDSDTSEPNRALTSYHQSQTGMLGGVIGIRLSSSSRSLRYWKAFA